MENEQLVARIQAGEDVAENMLKLYNQCRGFLAKMAKRYQGCAELEDLMQEGYFGLSEAVSHYDASQGASFIRYAAFWIRQSMKRYIENYGSAIRLPVYVRENVYKYNRAVKEYRKDYGEWPSESALCRLLNISREKLQKVRENALTGQMRSLSELTDGDGEALTLEDAIASDEDLEGDVIREADTASMKRELWVAVDCLPGNLPEVIRRRYIDGQTLREIGAGMGISYSHVGQLEKKAIRKLGQPGISRKYRGYYEEYLSAGSCRHVGLKLFRHTGMSEVELEVLGWDK